MSFEYSVERRLRQQKLRRKARRGEIALRRLYKFIRFLFIMLLFYLVYRIFICHYWYLPNNIYNDKSGKHLEILGNSIVSNDKILNELKKFPFEKKPIYRINPDKIANQIEQLTPVKRAYIRRYWLPARLVIMVEEVTPAIVIAPTENAPVILAFSRTGETIGKEYLPIKDNDVIKILSYGTKGDDYKDWDIEKINSLYKLGKLIEEYSGEKVAYIDLRTPHDAYAQLQTVRLRLGEIDVSVFERIKAIYDILPVIKQKQLKVKYVDLSWKETKYIKEDVGG